MDSAPGFPQGQVAAYAQSFERLPKKAGVLVPSLLESGSVATVRERSKNLFQMPDFPKEKKMVKGDWKCAKCGGAIKELPFEPRNTTNLKCRDCWWTEKKGE